MKRLIVKPMPQRSAVPKSCVHEALDRQVGKSEPDGDRGAAEHADEFADDEAAGDAERQRVDEAAQADAREGHAGIGEAEDGHDDEGNDLAELVLEPVERRVLEVVGPSVLHAQRDREGEPDAGKRRVDAGAIDEDPEHDAEQQVGPELQHAAPVEGEEKPEDRRRRRRDRGPKCPTSRTAR